MYHIRLLTVHTTDMSRKIFPLKRMLCRIREDANIDGDIVTEANIDGLIKEGKVTPENIDSLLAPDLYLSQDRLEFGAPSIECNFDGILSSPYIVGAAIKAEQEGCSAVVIDCVGDPALHAAREAVRIPVIGAGESALIMAANLGHKFSVVTITDRVRPMLEAKLTALGLGNRCKSIRAIEIPGVHTEHNDDLIHRLLSQECLEAIVKDGADAIVLGCTAFLGASSAVAKHLKKHEIRELPVIDPLPSAIVTAKSLLEVGLTHSLATYPPPPVKLRTGYLMPEKYNVSQSSNRSTGSHEHGDVSL